MNESKRRAVLALLGEYDKAVEALTERRASMASAGASWSLHKELEGFAKDGETLEYDPAEADRILANYRRDVDNQRHEVAAWRAAIVEALQ